MLIPQKHKNTRDYAFQIKLTSIKRTWKY